MRGQQIKVRRRRHNWYKKYLQIKTTINQLLFGSVNMTDIRMNTLRCIRHHPDIPLSRSGKKLPLY